MFTAATPSVPTPCPIKTPSIAVTADIAMDPRNVGIRSFLNRVDTFSHSKLIAFLFILLYLLLYKNAG